MNNHSILIDNLVFAKNNEQMTGVLTLADFPRLAELLQSETVHAPHLNKEGVPSSISFTLQGKTDAVGQHYLHLKLNASLKTTCQRCMSDMPLELALDFNYLIGDAAVNDIEASEIEGSDDLDLQQASLDMDVKALIEDEIIMAMPIAPIHEENCGPIITQSGEKANPFAALKGLIKP